MVRAGNGWHGGGARQSRGLQSSVVVRIRITRFNAKLPKLLQPAGQQQWAVSNMKSGTLRSNVQLP